MERVANVKSLQNWTGRCMANLVRWKQSVDPQCTYGDTQTMSNKVNDCIATCFPGGSTALHLADEVAVIGLVLSAKAIADNKRLGETLKINVFISIFAA